MALQHIRLCAPDPAVDAALEAYDKAVAELVEVAKKAHGRLSYLNIRDCKKIDADLVHEIGERLAPFHPSAGDGDASR